MTNKEQSLNPLLIVDFLAFGAMIFINFLGASGFFNGMSQAAISDHYPTLITPAGFTFSIWGLIYSLILALMVQCALKLRNGVYSSLIHKLSPYFLLSSFLNGAWIVAFSYDQIGLSSLLLFALLFSLIFLLKSLREHFSKQKESTLAHICFSIYTAWVLIATFVNVSAWLVKINWNGFGIAASIWTIAILFIALLFTIAYSYFYQNSIFPLSIIWAFWGIYKNASLNSDQIDLAPVIQALLLVSMLLLIALMFIIFKKNQFRLFAQ